MRAARSTSIVAIALVLQAGGCPSVTPSDVVAGPDLTAISTVVKAIYGMHGRGQIIFLGSDDDGVDSELLAQAGAIVQDELGVRVLPDSAADRSDLSLPPLTPKDPETGEVGISIRLGRFRVEEDGRLSVSAWAIRSGRDAQGYDVVLERSSDGWAVVQMSEDGVA